MNKNLLNSLAKLAKVSDVDALAKALQSETDTDFRLDTENLIVRTKQEEDTFKDNITKDIKDKAFSDAFEIQIKNLKKSEGLEFEGKKAEDFISALKSKILNEANIEPSKRITELENSLQGVNQTLQEKENEFNQLKNGFNSEKNRLKAESLIPSLPESLGLNKNEVTDLFFLKHEIKDDGIYKDGQRMVNNTTAEPLKIDDAVQGFISERGWDQQPTGRGGGSGIVQGANSTVSTLADFNNLASEKGYRTGGKEYNALLAQVVKENPEIIGAID